MTLELCSRFSCSQHTLRMLVQHATLLPFLQLIYAEGRNMPKNLLVKSYFYSNLRCEINIQRSKVNH